MLDEWNWSCYVAGYGASGVTPPPPATVTIARTAQGIATNPFSDQDQLRYAMASTGFEVTIPDGYQATRVHARVQWSGWYGYIDVIVGHRGHRFKLGKDSVWDDDLSGQTGTIPLTIMVPEGLAQWTVSFEVICSLTTERMDRWRLSTHAAILAARATARTTTSSDSADCAARCDCSPPGAPARGPCRRSATSCTRRACR